MENLNPIEVLEKLRKDKIDGVMQVFGEDYIAMMETMIETFEYYGYEVMVNKK